MKAADRSNRRPTRRDPPVPPTPTSTRPVRAVASLLVCVAAAVGLAVGCRPVPPPPQTPPPPLVTVARPAVSPVQNYYDYNGYLEAVETVEVRARVKGYLNKVFFKEGDEVKAGDPLYQIDPREYLSAVAKVDAEIAQANASIDSAKVKVEETNTEWGRLKDLQGASDKEKTAAKSAWEVAKAQLKLAEANLQAANASLRTANIQLGYTDIKAPIAGRISRTLVTPGNLVGQTESTLLTTIVSTDPIYVYFDAPERDLVEYQKGVGVQGESARQAGTRPVQVGVATEDGFPHAGELDFRENRVDSGTGTVRLRGRLPNPKGANGERVLYPGLFARVRVPLGPPADRPVIPEEALMTGQEGRYVYVLGPENKVKKQSVKVGATVWRAPPADDKAPRWQLTADKPDKDGKVPPPGVVRSVVAIEGGLSETDVVVVNGLQKARPGAPVTPDERRFQPPPK